MARTDRRALVFRTAAGILAAIAVFPGCRRERPEPGAVTPIARAEMASPIPASPVPSVDETLPTPTSSPSPVVVGAVYEVTIPGPSPGPLTEAEAEPTPLDLRKVTDRDVTPPVLVQRAEPRYPEASRRARKEGQVVIEAVITERGEVISPRVVQSTADSTLNEAALQAVRQWRYQPARVRGQPARVYLTLQVTFRLN